MTGTLRSLHDWLTDQLREIRHASPAAVLAPSEAVCAVGRRTRAHEPPCDAETTVLARVRHVIVDGERRCGDGAVIDLCRGHHADLVEFVERYVRRRCACGYSVLEVSDVVQPVITR